MTEEEWDKIDNYFFVIQIIAERANDEFADAIKLVCDDAQKYTWSLQKELGMRSDLKIERIK